MSVFKGKTNKIRRNKLIRKSLVLENLIDGLSDPLERREKKWGVKDGTGEEKKRKKKKEKENKIKTNRSSKSNFSPSSVIFAFPS